MKTKRKKQTTSPTLTQLKEFKKEHPDALLLFRVGDFYEAYNEDAYELNDVLGLNVVSQGDTHIVSFPHYALDTYIHKIVRAGNRVAICDSIQEEHKVVPIRYNKAAHHDSLTKFFTEHETMTDEQREKLNSAIVNHLKLSKEIFDLVEEIIYDWCEDNNVIYESVLEGCTLGQYLKEQSKTD